MSANKFYTVRCDKIERINNHLQRCQNQLVTIETAANRARKVAELNGWYHRSPASRQPALDLCPEHLKFEDAL